MVEPTGNGASQFFSSIPPEPQQDIAQLNTTSLPVSVTDTPGISALKNRSIDNNIINNVTQQLSSAVESTANIKTDFPAVPNPLNAYSNVTYHIRWSMTSDIDGSNITSINGFQNIQKTIVAESGMTAGFNIVDFELNAITAPNNKTNTMNNTDFVMTIKEPYGFSLIDNLYIAGKNLQVRNHFTMQQFIEIWFTGYDDAGNLATNYLHSSLYKLMRIQMTEIDSDVTASGTTYTVKGMISDMFANKDNIAMAPNGVNVRARTIDEFFRNLEAALNDQQKSLEYDFKSRVVYKINVPNWMYSWKFSQAPTTSRRSSEINITFSPDLPMIHISRGMDLHTILYFVLSMTEQGRDFVAGENRSPGQTASVGATGASLSANGMANMITIHSQAKIIGFDDITNDYIRQVTFTFMKYPTARAMIDATNVNAAMQPNQQADRRRAIINSGRYQKTYNFIYSGTNTDVIKFDMKLELTWSANIPNQLGENTYSNGTIGDSFDPNSALVQKVNKYIKAKQQAVKAQAIIDSATEILSKNGISNEERKKATDQLSLAKQELSTAQHDAAQLATGSNFQHYFSNQSSGQQALTNASSASSVLGRTITTATKANSYFGNVYQSRRDSYLEDISIYNTVDNPTPISFRIDPVPQSSTTVGGDAPVEKDGSRQSPGNLPRTRSLVSSLLNDVTSNPYFSEIEIEIKGDPYWIGAGNILESQLVGDGNTTITPSNDYAFFWYGDTGFYFTLRTGESPDENTGLMQFNKHSIVWEGIYHVTEIKSVFKEGKFTQILKAIKDVLTLPKKSSNPPSNPASNAAAQQTAASLGFGV